MDLHISVIADVKDIASRISTDIEIVDWSLSGHTWVFNKTPTQVNCINQSTWQSISPDLIRAFHETYDAFLSTFDGFIVAHPNVFALLFEKYGKPVIVVNTCRYDMPMCTTGNNKNMISELNSCFQRLQEKGLLHFISNNKADREYSRLANPEIHSTLLPSLCLYTNLTWNPTEPHSHFLIYSGPMIQHPQLKHRKQLGHFKWETLMSFKGIIHIPYEASTMSIFEHISSGAPLFFPTARFLHELIDTKKASIQSNYWRIFAKQPPPDYLSVTDTTSFWLDRADYYDLEGMYYFDSFDDLVKQLDNFVDVKYAERMNFIEKRKTNAIQRWSDLFQKITHQ